MSRMSHPDKPLVYGYLCIEKTQEVQVATWRREISDFCTASGYRLGSIFIDRGGETGSFARSGFVNLLTALRLPGSHAVVVPSLAQLSPEALVQQVLVHMVQLTNSQLLVCRAPNRRRRAVPMVASRGVNA